MCGVPAPTSLLLPSAFSPQQSSVPDVPAVFLPRVAQLSSVLSPGSSPSQEVPVMQAGAAPGPLRVPKAERLSPTLVCGEPGCLQGAPFPAGSLTKHRVFFFPEKVQFIFYSYGL